MRPLLFYIADYSIEVALLRRALKDDQSETESDLNEQYHITDVP